MMVSNSEMVTAKHDASKKSDKSLMQKDIQAITIRLQSKMKQEAEVARRHFFKDFIFKITELKLLFSQKKEKKDAE